MKTFRLLLTIAALLTTTVLAAQTPTTAKPDTVCQGATGEEYFVHKTAGSTYSWSLSGGGTIATTKDTLITVDWDNTTGIDSVYIVETNTHGCVGDTVKLAVVRVAPPVADAGSDQTIGACQTTTIGPAAPVAKNTYSWSPATGLSDPNVANPTVSAGGSTITYSLTVTSPHGCVSTDDVTITVDNAPVADAGVNDTIGGCGQSTTLDASASTGTNLSYQWSPAGSLSDASISNPVATPASTTTYTVTVTDDYGCTSTETVEVVVDPAPVADAGQNDSIGSCAGQSVTLDATASSGQGISYQWAPAASLTGANTASPTASPSATTTYTVTVTDKHGCTSTDDVKITVDPLPVADAGINDTICNGSSTQLNASASTGQGLSYSWTATGGYSSNAQNPTVSPASTTTYTLEVTDKHGCTSTATVTVVVDPAPTADAGPNTDDVCEGNNYSLSAATATNNSGVTWTTSGTGTFTNANATNPAYIPSAADIANGSVTLTITAQSAGACPDATDQITITIDPKPTTSPIYHY
jgi:hypothetical protein